MGKLFGALILLGLALWTYTWIMMSGWGQTDGVKSWGWIAGGIGAMTVVNMVFGVISFNIFCNIISMSMQSGFAILVLMNGWGIKPVSWDWVFGLSASSIMLGVISQAILGKMALNFQSGNGAGCVSFFMMLAIGILNIFISFWIMMWGWGLSVHSWWTLICGFFIMGIINTISVSIMIQKE